MSGNVENPSGAFALQQFRVDADAAAVLTSRRWVAVQLSFSFEDRARVATSTPALLKAA